MGNKRMKHLNELRVKAMAGDRVAAQRLAAETFVAHHLRRPDPLGSTHRKIGTTFKKGVHVTAKTLKGVGAMVSTTIHPEYGFDRLQMLKDRRDRRNPVADISMARAELGAKL